MCSVTSKRPEASPLADVPTSLIMPEYECVQVNVLNCGDDATVITIPCEGIVAVSRHMTWS